MARKFLLPVLAVCASFGAQATCWSEAQLRYDVPAGLLYGIARAESDLDARAVNRSHLAVTGTYDIGLMQINSGHLAELSRHGVTEDDLFEPCTSVMVGAWILRRLFDRFGPTWEAVGAYNAACTRLKGADCQAARSKYAWRVFRRMPHAASAEYSHADSLGRVSSSLSPVILAARVSP